MTLDIPQSIKDQFPLPEDTSSQGSQNQGSEGSQSLGSWASQSQGSKGNSARHGAQSQVNQAGQSQQPPKTQKEVDVEIFAEEVEDSGLNLDLEEQEISDPDSSSSNVIDDNRFVLW
jgi:hypothetical protein